MFYWWPFGSFIQSECMKANVYLRYSDGSETCFKFECDESYVCAIGTLYVVCRGTLLASSAESVAAYDEKGDYLFTYST